MRLHIATTTFYPNANDLRFELASRFVKDAVAEGHKVVVVDDSPDAAVADRFLHLGAVVEKQTAKGMGPGRRQALKKAYDLSISENQADPAFAWIEPEKFPLVPYLKDLVPLIERGADIVIPRRQSLASYPTYQEACELRGNWAAGSLTGRPELDLWFGPRLMGFRGLRYFLDYEGDHGDRWDSIFIPVVRAIAIGRSVLSATVPYLHPAEQTAAEEGNLEMDKKRDIQLETLLACIRTECKKLGLPRAV